MLTLTMLVSFSGSDGASPEGGLLFDAAGNLVGTTNDGGANDVGTVFEIGKTATGYAGTPTVLANFDGTSGARPAANLIADAAGNLFGTTSFGGANGVGCVFEIAMTATGYASTATVLASFNGADGQVPQAGLIADGTGNLFGTTSSGGANGDGNVFEIAKTASGYAGTPTVLTDFSGTNGANPSAKLTADATGNLFGTTSSGGPNNGGTVFEIAKTASRPSRSWCWAPPFQVRLRVRGGEPPDNAAKSMTGTTSGFASIPTVLASFGGGTTPANPMSGLIADAAGDLFGTSAGGGVNGDGTVFALINSGGSYTLTTLVDFNGTNGANPTAALLADAKGTLFGTTSFGGANSVGTVFEISKTGTGFASTPTTLVDFDGSNGANPSSAGLIADAAGNLFGTTAGGGANGVGMAFELSGTDFTVCFCSGTRVLTERGEVAVEELQVGERVVTLSGAVKPIRWIGMGRDLVTRANKLARPIIVQRAALSDNVPHRDLYLTHGHALYLDGVLIPVEHLVNHKTIRWDERAQVVEYYHIELDDHDVLLAEGAPAESYHDAGNRAAFHNARPGSRPGRATPTVAPVLDSGVIVECAWARLFERAGGLIEQGLTADPDLHLVLDGARIEPERSKDGVYRFAVPQPPKASQLLRSRCGVPSLLGQSRSDHRPLGVAITQLVRQQAGIATYFDYDQPQFREGGCYPYEDGFAWTDGEFMLPARFFTLLDGALTLLVHTEPHPDMRYSLTAAIAQAA